MHLCPKYNVRQESLYDNPDTKYFQGILVFMIRLALSASLAAPKRPKELCATMRHYLSELRMTDILLCSMLLALLARLEPICGTLN